MSKLKLKDLKVKSFVTGLDRQPKTVKGGFGNTDQALCSLNCPLPTQGCPVSTVCGSDLCNTNPCGVTLPDLCGTFACTARCGSHGCG